MKQSIQIVLIILLATVLNTKMQGQNLVPNPSFEEFTSCPWGQSQISFAVGWNSYCNTPDYFNSCDNNGQVGVPSNVLGFQFARTGNAYAGIYAYSLVGEYREFIGTLMKNQLIIGQKYYVTFYVSTAFNPNPGWHSTFAVNKLGVRFSTIPYSYSNPVPIDNYSQVYTDSIISDTINWVKISGSFLSDSNYSYVSFGNFFNNSNTTHISLDTLSSFAYYFIDDIIISTDSTYTGGIDFASYSFFYIRIFPNPARDWIIMEGSDIKSFLIIDIFGRKYIEDAFVPTSLKSIDVSNLSKGIYFIQVNTLLKSSVQKLIIQ
jgi:hypothetical protein